MTEELNNQDLFNLEDNDAFDSSDDFPDLPPLAFDKEEEVLDIEAIPVEEAADVTVETAVDEKPEKKEKKDFFAFLKKKDNGEKAPKEEKAESTAKIKKPITLFKAKDPQEKKAPKVKKEPRQPRENKEYDYRGLGPLFWSISGGIALLIAIILLIVVIVLGVNAVKIANAVNNDLVGELYTSFVQMDKAHIKTTIPIESEVPAQFDLLLDTTTNVILSEDTYISNATVSLSTGGLTITNAPTNIVLPAGSELPIHLVLTVPVDEMIPVVMDVEVDIPMAETELHEPFTNLQKTIQPYYVWLWSMTTKDVKMVDFPWNQ